MLSTNKDTLRLLMPLELGGVFSADADLEGDQLDTAQTAITALADEIFAATTDNLLADWERVCAITPAPGADLATRQGQVLQALRATGGLSRDYFISLAAALGYEITIEELLPFMADWGCADDELFDDTIVHQWGVLFTTQTEPVPYLEALFNRLKPAHTAVYFRYSEAVVVVDQGAAAETVVVANNIVVVDSGQGSETENVSVPPDLPRSTWWPADGPISNFRTMLVDDSLGITGYADSFSVSVWVKIIGEGSVSGPRTVITCFDRGAIATDKYFFQLSVHSTDYRPMATIGSYQVGAIVALSDTPLETGKWYLLTASYAYQGSNGQLKLLVNGILAHDSGSVALPSPPMYVNNGWAIGNHGNWADSDLILPMTNGLIGSVSIVVADQSGDETYLVEQPFTGLPNQQFLLNFMNQPLDSYPETILEESTNSLTVYSYGSGPEYRAQIKDDVPIISEYRAACWGLTTNKGYMVQNTLGVIDFTQDFSIEVWVKLLATPSTSRVVIGCWAQSENSGEMYCYLSLTTARKPSFVIGNYPAGAVAATSTTLALTLGEWQHIAVSYHTPDNGVSGQVKVYLDGSLAKDSGVVTMPLAPVEKNTYWSLGLVVREQSPLVLRDCRIGAVSIVVADQSGTPTWNNAFPLIERDNQTFLTNFENLAINGTPDPIQDFYGNVLHNADPYDLVEIKYDNPML